MSIVYLFGAYRLLLRTLDHERKEHAAEVQRLQTETLRLRNERDREWRRANEATERANQIELEWRYDLRREQSKPFNPREITERNIALGRNKSSDPQPHMGVRTISQSVRLAERESAARAEINRQQRAAEEERMEREAEQFQAQTIS